jgi:hypothetical protein
MKRINVYRTIAFLSLAIVVILFIYAPQPIAWIVGVFLFFLVRTYLSIEQGKEDNSFKNPLSLSENEAGLMLIVHHIKDNKIALYRWGYSANKQYIGVFEEFCRYYKPKSIPQELRIRDTIFKVIITDEGLVCKKVEYHGFIKKPKQPFEVIEKSYTLS